MSTRLIAVREPSRSEKKRGAEVVFERKEGRRKYIILACQCYESWEQWGEPAEILSDNVSAVEAWRRHGLGACERECCE